MKKTEKIIAAIVTIVIGILLIVLKNNFIGILMTIGGGCLIVFGLIDLIQKEIPSAVVKLVVGVLIIVCGWALVQAVLYIAAGLLLIAGILLVYHKIKINAGCGNLLITVMEYALPVLMIVIGGLLLFHQAGAIEVIFIISGILTILEGAILLVNTFMEDM